MRLNYSRKKFAMYFLSPDKEAFLEGHVRAFEYFGGVVERLSYDNLGLAVAHIAEGKNRILTKEFKELKGFYAFKTNFCKPGKEGAHEKGGVESGIGFSRRNWMVPVPQFESLDELNSYILAKCHQDEARQVHGESQTIGEAWEQEKPLLLPLPANPFDPGVRSGCIVDNYCTVALKNNHYSVPAKFVGRSVSIRSYWNRVVISDGVNVLANHVRSYGKDEYLLSPEHYLDLLEKRPHAVPYARPLLAYDWPAGYWDCYQEMVSMIGPGPAGRDFIRLLRCHVKYGGALVSEALSEARALDISNVDVIIATIDQKRFKETAPELCDLSDHPALLNCKVTMFPEPAQYDALRNGGSNNEQQCTA